MGQEFIGRASLVSAVVVLTGVLVLAGLRPRPASGVRLLSLAALAAALLAAVGLASLFFNLIGCPPYGDFCGLQLAIAAYLLYFAAAGLCLLIAVAASASLARARRWRQLPLVGALGLLPLAYFGVIQTLTKLGPRVFTPTIANSAPLTATLSLLPILIYGLFFYRFPQERDRPSNGTNPAV